MFLELIATFVFGFAAAGVVLLVNWMTGRRLPRWLMPVAAGAAMIGFAIWSEYNWYPRTAGQLPEEVVIVSTNESRAIYRPWTYVVPYIDRFSAIDTSRALTNEAQPGQVIVPMIFLGRWAPGSEIPVIVDCSGSRRAELADGISFDDSGAVAGARWIEVDETDPLLRAACD